MIPRRMSKTATSLSLARRRERRPRCQDKSEQIRAGRAAVRAFYTRIDPGVRETGGGVGSILVVIVIVVVADVVRPQPEDARGDAGAEDVAGPHVDPTAADGGAAGGAA